MTNDGMLSQEEIDALLNVGMGTDDEAESLSQIEEDTLGEIGNISVGSSATTLSTLLDQNVFITTPEVSILEKDNVNEQIDFSHITIVVNYIQGFSGKTILIMKSEDAAVISDIMLGGDGTGVQGELNEIHLSAIQETMNQMMGTAATSMSSVFNKRVDISPPVINSGDTESNIDPTTASDDTTYVKVSFQLQIGELIDSSIMQLIPLTFAKQLANQLLHAETADTEAVATTVAEETKDSTSSPWEEEKTSSSNQDDSGANGDSMNILGSQAADKHAPVEKALFSELEHHDLTTQEHRNLDMLMDISLQVTVELGRTKRSIKDILNLSSGSIIELDKLAGEPVDILVNEKRVARGEVVVIDENFGVRITDILSQSERLNQLNK